MLKAIQDATSYDVHTTCPQAQAMLKSIQAEAEAGRPASVDSHRLVDHTQYTSVPRTQKWDYADQWDDF